jgi:hypothetical protein
MRAWALFSNFSIYRISFFRISKSNKVYNYSHKPRSCLFYNHIFTTQWNLSYVLEIYELLYCSKIEEFICFSFFSYGSAIQGVFQLI